MVITVTTNADVVAVDGQCSLREALQNALPEGEKPARKTARELAHAKISAGTLLSFQWFAMASRWSRRRLPR